MRGPHLFPGARVALIAPSSPLAEGLLASSVEKVRGLGLEPVVFPSATARHGYLSGTDDVRAADINRAFADKDIHGVWCLRGGCGGTRLLPLLDFSAIRANPKLFGGYSDITAFHIAIGQNCGFGTYHMVMPASDLCPKADEYTLAYAKAMLFGERIEYVNPRGNPPVALSGGRAEGELCGGNLSLVAASLGTPWELDTRGKLLFLEDIDEKPYRIDGMLTQLRNAGKIEDCAGIILGQFTDCVAPDPEKSLSLARIFEELIVPAGKPALRNVLCGHCAPTMSLPLGARFSLDADACAIAELL